MKVIITIEDDAKSGDISLTSLFSDGVSGTTNSTAAWMGTKLVARAMELSRERKKAPTVQPPQPPQLTVFL